MTYKQATLMYMYRDTETGRQTDTVRQTEMEEEERM